MADAIAIVGGGTAGLATACLLARSRYRVTVFERFENPMPVGAGILVQPTGMAVLASMGLLDAVAARASRIERMDGRTLSGRRIMDIRYADAGTGCHGLGVHRGNLFQVLHDAAFHEGVEFRLGTEVTGVTPKGYVTVAGGDTTQRFDGVVVANGTQSDLPSTFGIPWQRKPYPWGAVWAIRKRPDGMTTDCLEQRYHRASVMIGLLPTGILPDDGEACTSFFWSLKTADYPVWREGDLTGWKRRVIDYWPAIEGLLATAQQPNDFAFASYADVVMRRWHAGKVVVIGDAAHGMSPQLGQGTNLALLDARVLAHSLASHGTIEMAFAEYSRLRRKHLRFYQLASRWLTPVFQSDSQVMVGLRDWTFPALQTIPISYREALRMVTGVKTGVVFDWDVPLPR